MKACATKINKDDVRAKRGRKWYGNVAATVGRRIRSVDQETRKQPKRQHVLEMEGRMRSSGDPDLLDCERDVEHANRSTGQIENTSSD